MTLGEAKREAARARRRLDVATVNVRRDEFDPRHVVEHAVARSEWLKARATATAIAAAVRR